MANNLSMCALAQALHPEMGGQELGQVTLMVYFVWSIDSSTVHHRGFAPLVFDGVPSANFAHLTKPSTLNKEEEMLWAFQGQRLSARKDARGR